MKIVFDQGTPAPLRDQLPEHEIDTAFELAWSHLRNGELLDAAEAGHYDILVTTDQNLKYQQNLSARNIAIVVILSTSWPRISQRVDSIRQTINAANAGDYIEVAV